MMKISHKLCILFIVFGLTACSMAPVAKNFSPDEKSAAVSDTKRANERGIEGTWEGLILQGAALTYIRLELSPAQKTAETRRYTGKAYAQSFENYLKGYSVTDDIHATHASIQATYDPFIRTFQLQAEPGGRHGGSALLTHFRNLGGVFDRRKDALAGLWQGGGGVGNAPANTGNQYFLFVRPRQFGDAAAIFERLQKPYGASGLSNFSPPLIGVLFQLSGLGGPGKDTLRTWVQPLYDEYPDLDLYRSTYGRFELLAIKLFRDHHFKKHFKKPFDELSLSELAKIQRAFISLKKDSRNISDRSTSVLERMFWAGRGDNAALQTALWIKAQRHLLNWHQDRLDELGNLPGRKDSLKYADQLEEEIEKIAATLLWPSELTADKQRLASTRQRIALPALKTMLAEFESSSASHPLMNRLASWQSTESRLFGYLNEDQSRSLLDAANKRLDRVIAELLPPYNQRITSLGTGLAAINNGNSWYGEFSSTFAKVIGNNQVQESLGTFKRQRTVHLSQAQDEMLTQIRRGYEALPTELSKSADSIRLHYIASLKQLAQKWFAVPGDSSSATVKTVTTTMAELGGKTAGLLPPRLASNTGFEIQPVASTDLSNQKLFRSKVHPEIARHGVLADNDDLLRQLMPKPIRDAGFNFKSNIVWALFHGRFDELDSRYYKGKGIGSDIAADYYGINPRFHYAFITYLGLASTKHGNKQIGPTGQVSWKTTREGKVVREGYGKIYMPEILFPYYERSYKLATKISSTDAMFGNNGLGILQTLLDFGTGKIFQKSGIRPDGEFQYARADWEQDILEDLSQLLASWPQQSYGLWQLQENIARCLKGRPSLQALYNYAS